MADPASAGDAPPRKAIFGRKSQSSASLLDSNEPAGPSSSGVASALRPSDDAPPPVAAVAASPSSAHTAAALRVAEDDERRRIEAQQLQELQELRARRQGLEAPPPPPPVYTEPLAPPAPGPDPDGADHSVDPSAPSQSESSGPAPDVSWLQQSSMQASPVHVYYSKDPISNLQVRVLLRRQPDDASANSKPKTIKQLNLAIKEKQKKEEREREARESVAGQTTAAALHGLRDAHDEGDSEADRRDAAGRLPLSATPEVEFKPTVLAIQLFSWQQKVCSPCELLQAATGLKSASSFTDQAANLLRERYPHDDLEGAARKHIASQRDGMMLSSKRDHDRYIDPDDLHKMVTTSRHRELNPLAERVVLAPLVSKRSESHLTREGGSTPFHILATVDLPNDHSSVRLVNRNESEISDTPPAIANAFQKPLAIIKVTEGDEYCTLEMRPAFSPPQKNPAEFDDAEWYSFHTPSGETFRYRIENYSGVLESEQAAEAAEAGGAHSRALIALEARHVEAEVSRMQAHEMQVAMHRSGRDFDQGPLLGFETSHVMGEIIKTSGFTEDHLSVSYEIDLRAHADGAEGAWSVDTMDRLEAVTQSSTALFASADVAGKPDVRECYFSFPFEAHLTKRADLPSLSPVLYLSVYATNSWGMSSVAGYGFVHVPLTAGVHDLVVSTWVPTGSLQDRKTKFFVGAGPSLRDVKLCGVPNDKEVLNRYGWQCTSSGGCIHVRMEVVQLRPATTTAAAMAVLQATPSALHTSLALDTLRSQYIRGAAGLEATSSPFVSSQLSQRTARDATSTLSQRPAARR